MSVQSSPYSRHVDLPEGVVVSDSLRRLRFRLGVIAALGLVAIGLWHGDYGETRRNATSL
jgi:hypothetical protein